MGAKSAIEWTDASYTPIRARNLTTGKIGWHCEHATTGCQHCYSEGINRRLGTGLDFKPGHRKDIEIFLDEKMLLAPLRWKKPRMIFVCSMTDLFADFVKDEWIDRIFAVMALCPQHTFQVLTKRAGRMREYMTLPVQGGWAGRVTRVDDDGTSHPEWDAPWRLRGGLLCDLLPKAGAHALNAATAYLDKLYGEDGYDGFMPRWPLPNVWLGVSAEDQSTFEERRQPLRDTPAAVRFFSLEPLLGRIDASAALASGFYHWVIVGGESGPHARPMHPDWVRTLGRQCGAARVPFFFKQWGEWKPEIDRDFHDPDWRADYTVVNREETQHRYRILNLAGGCGFHGERVHLMKRVGKKAAGRRLDGVEHNGMPNHA